ncbi:MAG: NAD(P)-dependent oxidoreductase [Chloroflexi bacterium]|nr:NAD(P)-dependent oxidoreductase [Chloroflexota bacterium]
MTVLITGGMGFIGLHTARKFLDAGEDVVVTHYRVQRTPDFIADELGKKLSVETVDVTSPHDLMEVSRKHNVDGIIHLAVPGLGALRPAEEYRVNMLGLINVLEAGRQLGMRRVSLASSGAVYGGMNGPFKESDPLPIDSQGSTAAYKKAWEILAQLYVAQTGQDVAILRLGGIWGPLYHSMANLPSRLSHAAVKSRVLDFSRGGVPFRDDMTSMCYVKDCGLGIRTVHNAEKLANRVYNVGGGDPFTNGQLVDAIAEEVQGFNVDLQAGASPRNRPSGFMDLSQVRTDTGYEPQFQLQAAVHDYVGWLREHPE